MVQTHGVYHYLYAKLIKILLSQRKSISKTENDLFKTNTNRLYQYFAAGVDKILVNYS